MTHIHKNPQNYIPELLQVEKLTKELEYDIVVVGAGPAGSSAAHMAAKTELK